MQANILPFYTLRPLDGIKMSKTFFSEGGFGAYYIKRKEEVKSIMPVNVWLYAIR